MPKAKKLPSGSYRARVYSYTDANGKKHYESFTAPTKAEAEMKAAQFKASTYKQVKKLTVLQAIEGYINAKRKVLSPSTVREYDNMARRYFAPLSGKRADRLNSEDVQIFISDLSGRVSAKTVQNVYSLLTASVGLYYPDKTFRVTLPAKTKKRPVSPSDEDVARLYETADDKLKLVLTLAMLGMRRGEIAALKYEDITDHIAHIHADIVHDTDGKWIYKEVPKTDESDRYIRLPSDFPCDGSGYVIGWLPNTITKRFIDHRKSRGLTLRLHDLRHYFASTAALIMPDLYAADLGGWARGGSAMKTVYQNNVKSMSDYYAQKMVDHIDQIRKRDA